VAELSELADFAHTRANVWRCDPGAKGRRHKHHSQEGTFVVLSGTLTMYLGDPPERHDVPAGGLIHVKPGTPLQTVNHGEEPLMLYAYGAPPEDEHAEALDSALCAAVLALSLAAQRRTWRRSVPNALPPTVRSRGRQRVAREGAARAHGQ
jgi:mannose-6-phosphate isomerase-like protein (cupin superfamily)